MNFAGSNFLITFACRIKNNNTMDIKQGFRMGIDPGYSSLGIGAIDINTKSVCGNSVIFSKNSIGDPVAYNTEHRTKRIYVRRAAMRARMRRVLHILGFLPKEYEDCFNFVATDTDRGLGTLKKGLSKHSKQKQNKHLLFCCDEYITLSKEKMRNWVVSEYPEYSNHDVNRSWLPLFLSMYGMEHELTDYELALVLMHFTEKRGSSFNDGSDEDKKKETEFKKNKKETESMLSAMSVSEYELRNIIKSQINNTNGINSVGTVDRSFYERDLRRILDKQMEFKPVLNDRSVFESIVENLYPNNTNHREFRLCRKFSLADFIIDDVIMYQRSPLSNKSKIRRCPVGSRTYKSESGEVKTKRLQCVSKSHPEFQRYRIYQFCLNTLKIKNKNTDECFQFDGLALAEKLWRMSEITKTDLFQMVGIEKPRMYDWNMSEPKFECNKTGVQMADCVVQAGMNEDDAYSMEVLEKFWHILYSVTDPKERNKAFITFARKNGLNEEVFVERAREIKNFSGYGAYSLKVIRMINRRVEAGESFADVVYDVNKSYTHSRCQNTDNPEYLYVILDRMIHEGIVGTDDYNYLRVLIKNIVDITKKNGGLPEQIMIEGTKTIKPNKKETDEIINQQKEYTKLRNRCMAVAKYFGIKNVPANSVLKYRMYEEFVTGMYRNEDKDKLKEFNDARTKLDDNVTKDTLREFINLLDKKYVEIYTGRHISIADALDGNITEKAHTLARAKTADNSISNMTITYKDVNDAMDDDIAMEFIRKRGGSKIKNGKVRILMMDEYIEQVKKYYSGNAFKEKREKLLAETCEPSFKMFQKQRTERRTQLIQLLLWNLYPNEKFVNIVSSAHVMLVKRCNKFEFELKNRIIKQRLDEFAKRNGISQDKLYHYNEEGMLCFDIQIPDAKRMDYRTHMMDAIACAAVNDEFVRMVNNPNNRYSKYGFKNQNDLDKVAKPWKSFTNDVFDYIVNSDADIISRKRNVRNKRGNYEKYERGKKVIAKTKYSKVICSKLHDATLYGLSKDGRCYTGRASLVNIFAGKKKYEDVMNVIENGIHYGTDNAVQKILTLWADMHKDDIENSFSDAGVEEMNIRMGELCDKLNMKKHAPIVKCMKIETADAVKSVKKQSDKKNESGGYVNSAKRTYIGGYIYQDKDKRRFVRILNNGEVENPQELEANRDKILKLYVGDKVYIDDGGKKIAFIVKQFANGNKLYFTPFNADSLIKDEFKKDGNENSLRNWNKMIIRDIFYL